MTAGTDLLGQQPAAPRKRGRPKGSTNKRAADLAAWTGAVAGSTAAMQSAQLCMVTLKEAKAAGGDLVKALMAKAAGHVAAFEAEQEKASRDLRSVVRQELRLVIEELAGSDQEDMAKAVDTAVRGMIDRIRAPGDRLTLRKALDMMAAERAALMPYTDQRQPQRVDVQAKGFAPAVVMVGGGYPADPAQIEQKQGVIEGAAFVVSPSKSHAPEKGEE